MSTTSVHAEYVCRWEFAIISLVFKKSTNTHVDEMDFCKPLASISPRLSLRPTLNNFHKLKFASILCASVLPSAAITAAVARSGKLKWLGINESGAEFGQGKLPGVENTDYVFPSTTTINQLIQEGYNIFRVPFTMERMVPNSLTGPPASTYLSHYAAVINSITNNGAYAVIDPHNFGRYYNNIITDSAGFQAFWKTIASQFSSNTRVIFDTNNEYHDEDQTNVFNMNQAAINGIRAAGATSQYIFIEGNSYSGAWTWTSATTWLRQNKKLGVLGEMAGGNNAQCQTAVKGLLDHLTSNNDVWLGALWWSAGPWWGSYMFSFEPPSGTGYVAYDSILKAYKP